MSLAIQGIHGLSAAGRPAVNITTVPPGLGLMDENSNSVFVCVRVLDFSHLLAMPEKPVIQTEQTVRHGGLERSRRKNIDKTRPNGT